MFYYNQYENNWTSNRAFGNQRWTGNNGTSTENELNYLKIIKYYFYLINLLKKLCTKSIQTMK